MGLQLHGKICHTAICTPPALNNLVKQQSSVIDVLLKQLAYNLPLVYGSVGTVLYNAAECGLMQCSV